MGGGEAGGGEFGPAGGGESAPSGESTLPELPSFAEGGGTEFADFGADGSGSDQLPELPSFGEGGGAAEPSDQTEFELSGKAPEGGDTRPELLDFAETGDDTAAPAPGEDGEATPHDGDTGDTPQQGTGSDTSEPGQSVESGDKTGATEDQQGGTSETAQTGESGDTTATEDQQGSPAETTSAGEAGDTTAATEDQQSGTAEATPTDPGATTERQPGGNQSVENQQQTATEQGENQPTEAERFGRTEAEYQDLARDPDIGDRITDKTIAERDAALGVEQRDGLGKLVRDTQGADFVDTDSGQQWDVKAFNSNFSAENGGFEVAKDAGKVDRDLGLGENVIVDTRNMNEQDVGALKAEGDRRGWGDRVRWWP
jgi:hypothetical protein